MKRYSLLILIAGLLLLAAFKPADSPLNFELQVLGQKTYLSGAPASLRIIAFNPGEQKPVSGVKLKLSLIPPKQKTLNLTSGKTDQTGSWQGNFKIPSSLKGNAELLITAGNREFKLPVEIIKKARIYLTTDKPLYQPGQTVNLRILALNLPDLLPRRDEELIFEIEDSKGNKVFKQKTLTSQFGIASAQFALAEELNMGNYKARAILAGEPVEKDFTVKKYLLPKFKIETRPDKSFYRPGETLSGKLKAFYFFGKPLNRAEVSISALSWEAGFRKFSQISGQTDLEGEFAFQFKIPDYLVGIPLEKENARLVLEISVTDTAGHKEQAKISLPVSQECINFELFPESKELKPNLKNRIYLLTGYPDNQPAPAKVLIKTPNETITLNTDQNGWGEFYLTPGEGVEAGEALSLLLSARDKAGNTAEKEISLNRSRQKENLILRVSDYTASVGEELELKILSTRSGGNVYLDVILNQQTILTQALQLKNRAAGLKLPLTPELTGFITLNAYQLNPDQEIIRDSKNILVKPKNELEIKISPQKKSFLPGEEGQIDFKVTDRQGNPVLSALGIDIVDEAVFALGEREAGFEKIYFLLENELLEPKYEIHGVNIQKAILNQSSPTLPEILFQKAPLAEYSLNLNTYTEKLISLEQKFQKIYQALYDFKDRNNRYPSVEQVNLLVTEGYLSKTELFDPWGNKMLLKSPPGKNEMPEVVSLGPDGKLGTADDLSSRRLEGRFPRFLNRELRFKGMAADLMMEKAGAMPALQGMAAPSGGQKAVRIREYFPETLYSNPQLITDRNGFASLALKMADSITSWRISAFAGSLKGELGSQTHPLRVFQDFFVDLDLPLSLTRNDIISIPATVYNYLPGEQKVRLELEKATWFSLPDEAKKVVFLKKDEVKVVYFKIKVEKLGLHKLTLFGYGPDFSDAVRRSIEILPDGEEQVFTESDKLDKDLTARITIPKNAIPETGKILLAIYPGVFAQVVEGLDKILRMPFGCFEQTSAVTYPNALVWDYLKKQKKLTPEIQMKAEGYINNGYQRLLSFEVAGGGFSWFGDAPANKILTAFGVMEFKDINRVYPIDERVIERTVRWLFSQQQPDGSWKPDVAYLHRESWGKIQGANLPTTAYISWALLEGKTSGTQMEKAVSYLKKYRDQAQDPYTLSLIANALVEFSPKDPDCREVLNKLAKMAVREKDSLYWESGMETATFSSGRGANLETTALAAIAFLKAEDYPEIASQALNFLIKAKDPEGTWYSTQATILAMKALLLAQEKAGQKVTARIKVSLNGKGEKTLELTPENYDVFQQVDFKAFTQKGKNLLQIEFKGDGSCYYQVRTKYYLPWEQAALLKHPEIKPLEIKVSYDRELLKQDDLLKCKVEIKNNTRKTLNMLIVDLGVPAGFALLGEQLDKMVEKQLIKKYSLTPRQLIIYLDKLEGEKSLELNYSLRAKYPIKAKTPASQIYEYYNPGLKDRVAPVTLEIK